MLESLRLKDFGGFHDVTLALHPRVTVLVGRNGSGKSTVTRALQLVLSSVLRTTRWLASSEADPDGPRFWMPSSLDVRAGSPYFVIDATASGTLLRWKFRADEQPDSWRLHADSENDERIGALIGRRAVLLVLGASRSVADTTSPGLAGAPPRSVARHLQDFAPGTTWRFHGLLDWVRREENLENEVRLRDDPSYRRPPLQAVRNALTAFLNQLGEAHYTFPRVSRVNPEGEPWADALDGRLVIDKDGVPLALAQLSDGEQLAVLTVMDLARRLVIADPKRDAPLSGPGLVVIDEVELHLHPGWQRRILPAMLATFPGLQFLVTTHSPQVVGSVAAESVRVLEGFQVHEAPPTLGRDSNSLLADVFDVPERASDVAEQLRAVAGLIDENQLEAATQHLERLAAQLTETDPEVVHLREMLDFMAS